MFGKYQNTLKWWALFCAQLLFLGAAWYFGILQFIWLSDITTLTLWILGLHYIYSIWFGFKINQLDRNKLFNYERDNKRSEFFIETQSDLGLLGTIFGFIIILQLGFSGLEVGNTSSMQAALTVMSQGLGTALLTTAVALTSKILLIIQHNILQKTL